MSETIQKIKGIADLMFQGSNSNIYFNPSLYDRIQETKLFSREDLAEGTAALIAAVTQPPQRVLDIGAGTGILSLELKKWGHEVVALDLHTEMLGKLRKKKDPTDQIHEIAADMNQQFPFVDETFGVITTLRANRFIQGNKFFSESRRLLKEGGILVLPVFTVDIPFWLKNAGIKQSVTSAGITSDIYKAGFGSVEQYKGSDVFDTLGISLPPFFVPSTFLVARQ